MKITLHIVMVKSLKIRKMAHAITFDYLWLCFKHASSKCMLDQSKTHLKNLTLTLTQVHILLTQCISSTVETYNNKPPISFVKFYNQEFGSRWMRMPTERKSISTVRVINRDKAGLFESSFFWGVNLSTPFVFPEEIF